MDTWTLLSESIADYAYTKLDLELEEGIDLKTFVQWTEERFKVSRIVKNPESLRQLYDSPVAA